MDRLDKLFELYSKYKNQEITTITLEDTGKEISNIMFERMKGNKTAENTELLKEMQWLRFEMFSKKIEVVNR